MEIRLITFKQACEFINAQHRHHKSTVGCKFSVGLFEDKKMVGCAVCGRPVSRYLDDGLTLEINRLCTDGTKNACSMLYGACCRIAKEMGYKKIITYKEGSPFAYDVSPETLCQFTGLCDKNGKKIWENDILKTWDDQYAQVKFGLYNTGFASDDYNQGFYAAFPKDSYYRHELGYWCKESYVRGNIFDNPELLQCESDFEVSDS